MDGMQPGSAPPPAEDSRAGAAMAVREASFRPDSWNAETRTVDLVFTTGADVERSDWWTGRRWVERLDVTPEAVDLSRLNAGAPLLDSHQSWGLGTVLGVVERAWIEGGQGMATVRFSDRPEIAGIVRDVASGILRNISAGYWVQEWQVAEASATSAEIRTAKRWQPGELSLVPVPADAGAQVRSAPSAAPTPSPTNRASAQQQEDRMSGTQQPVAPAAEATPANTPADGNRAAPQAPAAVRAATMDEIGAVATRGGLDAEWQLAQLRAGATLDQVRDAAIDAVAATRVAPQQPSSVTVTRDEGDTRRAGIEGWLLHRMDARNALAGPAMDYRGLSLVELARTCLEAGGTRTRGMLPGEIARRALNLPMGGMRAGLTSSDFPNLLANVQSKRLLTAYATLSRSFTLWAARRDLPDFKTVLSAELGMGPMLKVISQQGGIEYGTMGEGGETWSLVRSARNMALSYVAIQNDDLGGFNRIPQAFASAAANLENTMVYGLLPANAAMSDGVALFNSAHANTGSGALTVDNYTTIRNLILRQTDASGQQMMVTPNVLLVPTELEATALALFSGIVVPTAPTTTGVNPWRGSVEVVPTQFLTDATDWFVTVPSGTGYEAVEYGYEQGMTGPDLTIHTDPDVDGIVFSCRHSFGAKAVTYRTIARSTN